MNVLNSVYAGPLPKSLERFRDKIADVSDEGTGKDFSNGDGYWVYLLGYRQRDEYVHAVHEATISECVREMRTVVKCDCSECESQSREVQK